MRLPADEEMYAKIAESAFINGWVCALTATLKMPGADRIPLEVFREISELANRPVLSDAVIEIKRWASEAAK